MEDRRLNRGSITGGVILIIAGLALLLVTMGNFEINWDAVWPAILILAGVLVLVRGIAEDEPRRRAGWVLGGTIPLLLGVFFWLTTNGFLSWSDQGTLWPVYPSIVGVAFLAAWFVSGMSSPGYLIPGLILVAVGVVFGGLLMVGSYDLLGKLWPVLLILGGLAILIAPRARHVPQ